MMPIAFCNGLMFYGLLERVLSLGNALRHLPESIPGLGIALRQLPEKVPGLGNATKLLLGQVWKCDDLPYSLVFNLLKSQTSNLQYGIYLNSPYFTKNFSFPSTFPFSEAISV